MDTENLIPLLQEQAKTLRAWDRRKPGDAPVLPKLDYSYIARLLEDAASLLGGEAENG